MYVCMYVYVYVCMHVCMYGRVIIIFVQSEEVVDLFLHGLQGSPGAFGSANFALAISREASISALLWWQT